MSYKADLLALINLVESLIPIITRYPLADFTTPKFGNMAVTYYITSVPFVRLKWASTYKTPFTGALAQCYQLKDMYLEIEEDWTQDILLFKLLTAYDKVKSVE
jgi:hypothetical protein